MTRRRTEVASSAVARRRVEAVEVERRELLDDRRQHRVLGRVRALADRRRRQLQRQRVAADEAVDPFGLRLVEPGAAEHLGGGGRRERAERHREQQLAERRAPDRARRVARGEHDAGVLGQRGQEALAQPAVEQPQPLGGVDGEDDRPVGGGERRLDRGEEALRRRLDGAPVDGDDGGAALAGLRDERAQQRGLPGAGDAVDHGHERPTGVEQRGERRELVVAAGQRRAPLREQRSEGAAHGVRRRRARGPVP